MTLPRYTEYKNSGSTWIGAIPSSWLVVPLKAVTRIEMGQSPASDSHSPEEVGPPFLQGNADFGSKYPEARYYSSAITKFACKGDLLFSVRAPVGAINIADQVYGIGRGLCAIQSRGVDGSFLRYAMEIVRTELMSVATGSTYPAVSVEQVASASIIVPSVLEQRAIAYFLDRETAKIDALIAEQKTLIALLAEKRQATISRAVTRGLDSNAPLKDSGIPWLGEVPAHWEVKQLRYVASVVRGASPRPAGDPRFFAGDNDSGANCPWVTVAEVTKNARPYLTDVSDYLTPEGVLLSQQFRSGTLIFTNSGATLGVPKILAIDCCANDGIVAFNRLSPQVEIRFLYFFLLTTTERLRTEMKQGGGQPNLNTSIVKDISFSFPSLGEQLAIVGLIEAKICQFDVLATEAARTIDLLKERRSALIAAAVTGQIDVRGLVRAEAE